MCTLMSYVMLVQRRLETDCHAAGGTAIPIVMQSQNYVLAVHSSIHIVWSGIRGNTYLSWNATAKGMEQQIDSRSDKSRHLCWT